MVLHNSSKEEQEFEFGVPAGSYIAVTPRLGRVPARGSIRVQLEFSPPAELYKQQQELEQQEEVAEEGQGQGGVVAQQQKGPEMQGAGVAGSQLTSAAAAAAGAGGATERRNVEGSDGVDAGGVPAAEGGSSNISGTGGTVGASWHHYKQWLLPCFFRAVAGDQATAAAATFTSTTRATTTIADAAGPVGDPIIPTASGRAVGGYSISGSTGPLCKPLQGGSSSSSSSSGVGVVHLSVSTCAVLPELILVSELERPAGKNFWLMDFGPVPVGERVVKSLLLKNTGEVMRLIDCPKAC